MKQNIGAASTKDRWAHFRRDLPLVCRPERAYPACLCADFRFWGSLRSLWHRSVPYRPALAIRRNARDFFAHKSVLWCAWSSPTERTWALKLNHEAFRSCVRLYVCISLPLGPPRWTYWSVLQKFSYQGSVGYGLISMCFGIRPRRKRTMETFLEVAGRPAPEIEHRVSRSRQRRHGYARLSGKRRLRYLGHLVG